MSKFFITFVCLLFACEDPSDEPAPYDVEPVVEVCSGELCFSQAVPVKRTDDLEKLSAGYIESNHEMTWPKNGLDIELHQEWCEYYGWNIPSIIDLETILYGEIIDYYMSEDEDSDAEWCLENKTCVAPYRVAEHSQIGPAREFGPSIEWGSVYLDNCGCTDKFIEKPFPLWARCVKSNA